MSELMLLPCSAWLARPDTHIVTKEPTLKFQRDLIEDVKKVAYSLGKKKGLRVVIDIEDVYPFTVVLLALLSLKKIPILLGSRKSIEDSSGEMFDFVVRSTNSGEGSKKIISYASLFTKEQIPLSPIEEDATLVLYTSGSTGTPKAVIKTIRQMDAEAKITAKLFAEKVKDTELVSCVDPVHLYGLTFSVWMAFTIGVPLASKRIRFEENLEKLTSPVSLIATPTFLCYLDSKVKVPETKFVLSAGGKLSAEAIELASKVFGCNISEIYGSTEAGVVGTRTHINGTETEVWSFCPEIGFLNESNSETIVTPLVPEGVFTLEDKIERLSNVTFRLLGRQDRIVKIGEERVSLDEIARAIDRILTLKTYVLSIQKGSRTFVAVVVEDRTGCTFNPNKVTEYTKALRGHIPSVAIPRYWRCVKEMPFNSRGKLDREKLELLFK